MREFKRTASSHDFLSVAKDLPVAPDFLSVAKDLNLPPDFLSKAKDLNLPPDFLSKAKDLNLPPDFLSKAKDLFVPFLLLVFFSITNCKSRQTGDTDLSLARFPGEHNVAVIVPAPGHEQYGTNNLLGVERNVEELRRVLPGAGFKLAITDPNPPLDVVLETTRKAAQAVAAGGENGTLLWYFIGHSSKSDMYTQRSPIALEKLAEAINSAGKKFARIVIVADTCFSERLIGGDNAIVRQESAPLQSGELNGSTFADEGDFHQETSSQPGETDIVASNLLGNIESAFKSDAKNNSGEFTPESASLSTSQLLVMTSSEKNSFSYFTVGQGGAFSLAFVRALVNAQKGSIGNFFHGVSLYTRQFAAAVGAVQQPRFSVNPSLLVTSPLMGEVKVPNPIDKPTPNGEQPFTYIANDVDCVLAKNQPFISGTLTLSGKKCQVELQFFKGTPFLYAGRRGGFKWLVNGQQVADGDYDISGQDRFLYYRKYLEHYRDPNKFMRAHKSVDVSVKLPISGKNSALLTARHILCEKNNLTNNIHWILRLQDNDNDGEFLLTATRNGKPMFDEKTGGDGVRLYRYKASPTTLFTPIKADITEDVSLEIKSWNKGSFSTGRYDIKVDDLTCLTR